MNRWLEQGSIEKLVSLDHRQNEVRLVLDREENYDTICYHISLTTPGVGNEW